MEQCMNILGYIQGKLLSLQVLGFIQYIYYYALQIAL